MNEYYEGNMDMVPNVGGKFFGADVVLDEDQILEELHAEDPM